MLLNRQTAEKISQILDNVRSKTGAEFDIQYDKDTQKIFIPFFGKKIGISIFEDNPELISEKVYTIMSQCIFDLIKSEEQFDILCKLWNSNSSTKYGKVSQEKDPLSRELEQTMRKPAEVEDDEEPEDSVVEVGESDGATVTPSPLMREGRKRKTKK